ncbi:MAG: hypothetical protein ACK417_12230 [Bacteroidia bacterium]
MANQLIQKAGALFLLFLVSTGCERPLYFAGPESQPFSRLERAGDIQLQGAMIQSSESLQGYQAAAELAVTRYLALRGSIIRGGDDFSPGREFGRFGAHHLGVGAFYPLSNIPLKGSSWIGYSEGQVSNYNNRVINYVDEIYERISVHNSYERWFVEQQLRYALHGIEIFGVAQMGSTRVFNLSQQGDPSPGSKFENSVNWQMQNPRVIYASWGLGVSAGTQNLRVHFRADSWIGQATQQFSADGITFYSAGLSWRIETARIWGR